MDEAQLSIEVLAEWVVTGRDLEALLISAITSKGSPEPDQIEWVRSVITADLEHLRGADVKRLQRLRGNPTKLKQEIAGILRW